MPRMRNWDYSLPYYYMVTLKRLPGLPALSRLDSADPWGLSRDYALTRALSQEIIRFLAESPGLETVKPFIIMPDHLHILFKIKDVPERRDLPFYVRILKSYLRKRFRIETGIQTNLFEQGWHDIIVKKRRQLRNFDHYILNNPQMALLRQSARSLFHCYRDQHHYRLGQLPFDMVGNPELLDEPALVAVRISRKVIEGTPEWETTMSFYDRWKPGMTAVGTWWSRGEQAAARKILERGGFIIRLEPDGFGERWHPAGDDAQRAVAEGRVLCLSPYPPHTTRLPIGTLRARCLALNALAKQMEAVVID